MKNNMEDRCPICKKIFASDLCSHSYGEVEKYRQRQELLESKEFKEAVLELVRGEVRYEARIRRVMP